jgi:hypothetical protein
MMSQNRQRTAQILQFPSPGARGRFDRNLQVDTNKTMTAPQVDFAVYGGSWYHELAIQEVDRSRKP